MTKRDAKAQRAAWRLAVQEGRVLRYVAFNRLIAHPTVEACHRALLIARQDGITAVIAREE